MISARLLMSGESDGADREFRELVTKILDSMWRQYPTKAASMGLHEFDGRLPDISRSSLDRRAQEVGGHLESMRGVDAYTLSSEYYMEYKLVMSALNKELFDLKEVRLHETNPMEMLGHIELSFYISRDYAPLDQRVKALTRGLSGVPDYLASLRSVLGPRLSAPVLEACIEAYEGVSAFYEKDLVAAVSMLDDQAARNDFQRAKDSASAAVKGFVEHLRSMQTRAVGDFAIGEAKFLGLLKYGEMVDLPIERLLQVGREDLAANTARLRHVASTIDASKSPSEIMAEMVKDHPSADALIDETRDMLEEIRGYLLEHDIVSVPSEIRCATVETPSFMRWAFAALDFPGPFEEKATESYYYVTPVDEGWTEDEKEQWLTSFNYPTLRSVSVHEAYPGHYVHYLHTRNAKSKLGVVYGAYSFWEGWAHYAEQMMIEEGFGREDPRNILGQLMEALLRDCRYICAIGMHTQGMTVDEATAFFMANAFMEELPARKEAVRGTFDPMYLNYTLGKLMILKLREDYRSEQGENYSLKRFHDTFLSFGAPQIPLVREMMLQSPGRDVL